MIRCMPRPRCHHRTEPICCFHYSIIAAPPLYKRIVFDTNYTEHLLTHNKTINTFYSADVFVVSKQLINYVVHKSVGWENGDLLYFFFEAFQAVERICCCKKWLKTCIYFLPNSYYNSIGKIMLNKQKLNLNTQFLSNIHKCRKT